MVLVDSPIPTSGLIESMAPISDYIGINVTSYSWVDQNTSIENTEQADIPANEPTSTLTVASNPGDLVYGGGAHMAFKIKKAASLPVELTSFAARQKEKKVLFEWETASETNNSGFECSAAPTAAISKKYRGCKEEAQPKSHNNISSCIITRHKEFLRSKLIMEPIVFGEIN